MRKNSSVQGQSPSLSQIMDLDDHQAPAWSSQDLGAMLRHQLSLAVAEDVGERGKNAGVKMINELAFCGAESSPCPARASHTGHASAHHPRREAKMTLGELFADPAPPLRLLSLVKEFAKECHNGKRRGALPRDLCLALYYAAIIAARLRCGQRISELPDAALCRGLRWAVEQSWIEGRLGELLVKGLAQLSGDG